MWVHLWVRLRTNNTSLGPCFLGIGYKILSEAVCPALWEWNVIPNQSFEVNTVIHSLSTIIHPSSHQREKLLNIFKRSSNSAKRLVKVIGRNSSYSLSIHSAGNSTRHLLIKCIQRGSRQWCAASSRNPSFSGLHLSYLFGMREMNPINHPVEQRLI